MVAAPRGIVRMIAQPVLGRLAEKKNTHRSYSLIAAERGSDEPFYCIDELNGG
jgi:hypothetical protein